MIFNRARAAAMPQKPGIQGMLEKVEAAARTCYRSEGCTKYDDDGNSITAGEFVPKIVKAYKHESVAEHGTVYLLYSTDQSAPAPSIAIRYNNDPYSRVNVREDDKNRYFFITSNYRVLVENGWEDDLEYWSEPTEFHDIRYSVRLFTDRGVSAESNRHRANSPTERSTRFVNYGHDNAITICVPEEYPDEEIVKCVQEWGGNKNMFKAMCTMIANDFEDDLQLIDTWLFANAACEWAYLRLLKFGCKPQQARRILPMDIETELVISAYAEDWAKYFGWRFHGFTGPPHPDMKFAAGLIMDQFKEAGWDEPIILAEKYIKY